MSEPKQVSLLVQVLLFISVAFIGAMILSLYDFLHPALATGIPATIFVVIVGIMVIRDGLPFYNILPPFITTLIGGGLLVYMLLIEVHPVFIYLACILIFFIIYAATYIVFHDPFSHEKYDGVFNPSVEDWIINLKDPHPLPRRNAAKILGEKADSQAVEPLIAALKDEDMKTRKAAAEALGNIGDVRAIDPLTSVRENDSRAVRKAANEALKKINISNSEQ